MALGGALSLRPEREKQDAYSKKKRKERSRMGDGQVSAGIIITGT